MCVIKYVPVQCTPYLKTANSFSEIVKEIRENLSVKFHSVKTCGSSRQKLVLSFYFYMNPHTNCISIKYLVFFCVILYCKIRKVIFSWIFLNLLDHFESFYLLWNSDIEGPSTLMFRAFVEQNPKWHSIVKINCVVVCDAGNNGQ